VDDCAGRRCTGTAYCSQEEGQAAEGARLAWSLERLESWYVGIGGYVDVKGVEWWEWW